MDQQTADSIDALINDASSQALAWYSVLSAKPVDPTAAALATGQPIGNFVPVPIAPPALSLTGPGGFFGSLGSSPLGLLLVVAVVVGAVLLVKG